MRDTWSALSDPTRRAILALLRRKDLSAGEIADNFNISKPSISKHLDVLRQADLVCSEKKGQFIIYSLNTSAMEDMAALLLGFIETGKELDKDES